MIIIASILKRRSNCHSLMTTRRDKCISYPSQAAASRNDITETTSTTQTHRMMTLNIQCINKHAIVLAILIYNRTSEDLRECIASHIMQCQRVTSDWKSLRFVPTTDLNNVPTLRRRRCGALPLQSANVQRIGAQHHRRIYCHFCVGDTVSVAKCVQVL